MESGNYDFGMVGLGVMGSNLLLNMADHGYAVAGYDLDPEKTKEFESSATKKQKLKGVNTLEDLVACLKKPRKVMMLVPAGKPVDSVIHQMKSLLDKGDILIDGGNSHYTDTILRINEMENSGIHFMGVGISGGEEGARYGPSIMPGGDKEAYENLSPILRSIAAKVQDEPCVAYLGRGAAGHYVKMVHNGIEYAIMQLIGEAYDLMKHGLELSNKEMGEVFHRWDSGEMKSFLLEITSEIFNMKDGDSDEFLIDFIADKAGAKGTGKWTSQSGLDLPMPIPNIDVAVMMRNLSSLVDERLEADKLYSTKIKPVDISKEELEEWMHDALYFATIISYAQGLAMITTASKELDMDIPIKDVVKVWRGGCIIRSALLDTFAEAYDTNSTLKNLLLDHNIASILQNKLPAIQKIISLAAGNNYTAPGHMAAFCYFNAYRRRLLPTNLIQAQRDFFGAHQYQRIDKEGFFHTVWETSGS